MSQFAGGGRIRSAAIPTQGPPPPAAEPVDFKLSEFIVPQPLLAKTKADANPLWAFSQRRAVRPMRRFVRHSLEIGLLFFGFYIIDRPLREIFMTSSFLFPGFAFLLLRYHLLVNDQSRHVKALGEGQLLHLLQTPMTREDYFLHHFLAFCVRYRVIFGFVLIIAAEFFVLARADRLQGWWWEKFAPLIVALNLVVLTWLAGVAQYVIEWQLFAGGRWREAQTIATWPISLILAGFVSTVAMMHYKEFGSNYGMYSVLGTLAIFGVGVWAVYALGRQTYHDAREILWYRFLKDDPDPPETEQSEPMAADLIAPWEWRRHLTERDWAAVERIKQIGWGEMMPALAGAILFGLAFAAGYHSLNLVLVARGYVASSAVSGGALLRVLYQTPIPAFAYFVAHTALRAAPRVEFLTARALMSRLIWPVLALAILFARWPSAVGLYMISELATSQSGNPAWNSVAQAGELFSGFGLGVVVNLIAGYVGNITLWGVLMGLVLGIAVWARRRGQAALAEPAGWLIAAAAGAFWSVVWMAPQLAAGLAFRGVHGPALLSRQKLASGGMALMFNATALVTVALLLPFAPAAIRWGFGAVRDWAKSEKPAADSQPAG